MNKEFMLLNDNTIEVTNEEGKEINRGEFENNNVKGILLAENKVEITEKFKKAFDKELSENNEALKLSSNMLKLQAVFIVAMPAFGFLFGAISNPSTWIIHGIFESIYAFVGSIIPITTATIYWSIIRPKYKKNKIRIETILDKNEDIKKESERELITERNKVIANTLKPLVKVSLEEETYAITRQMSKELIMYTEENMTRKPKLKIRKR